jgi:hypothetical protein
VDETVDLAIRDGSHVLFIDQVAAPLRLHAVSPEQNACAASMAFQDTVGRGKRGPMSIFTPTEVAYLESQRLGRLATVSPFAM